MKKKDIFCIVGLAIATAIIFIPKGAFASTLKPENFYLLFNPRTLDPSLPDIEHLPNFNNPLYERFAGLREQLIEDYVNHWSGNYPVKTSLELERRKVLKVLTNSTSLREQDKFWDVGLTVLKTCIDQVNQNHTKPITIAEKNPISESFWAHFINTTSQFPKKKGLLRL